MSESLDRINYFYKQTDGTFNFPNSAEGDLLRVAQQEILDLHVMYRMLISAAGCGCCSDYQTVHELYGMTEAMKITGEVSLDNEINQVMHDELTASFHALRKRLGIKTYDEEMYGDEYADDE